MDIWCSASAGLNLDFIVETKDVYFNDGPWPNTKMELPKPAQVQGVALILLVKLESHPETITYVCLAK